MKTIKIHKHTPVRRRQSRYQIRIGSNFEWHTIFNMAWPQTIVHTGTTQENPTTMIKLHKNGTSHYEDDVIVFPELNGMPIAPGFQADKRAFEILAKKISPDKRPNILKRVLKKVRKYVK